ncbi:uncharacterized protein CPUR_06825 [Claviceps purpurea 20.1]|uniref:Uncharacterized protein n=1 Tax=Claviceps purpurea (strain 20.1) TaxID=1111077 RepID=M1WED5_CLAP2|nr:uncharacterized protein CPUR_06825 [Claviceps purpurea 20.1]
MHPVPHFPSSVFPSASSAIAVGQRGGGSGGVATAHMAVVVQIVVYAEDVKEVEEAEEEERDSGDTQTEEAAKVEPVRGREEHGAGAP